jgi:hypothetical protein
MLLELGEDLRNASRFGRLPRGACEAAHGRKRSNGP